MGLKERTFAEDHLNHNLLDFSRKHIVRPESENQECRRKRLVRSKRLARPDE